MAIARPDAPMTRPPGDLPPIIRGSTRLTALLAAPAALAAGVVAWMMIAAEPKTVPVKSGPPAEAAIAEPPEAASKPKPDTALARPQAAPSPASAEPAQSHSAESAGFAASAVAPLPPEQLAAAVAKAPAERAPESPDVSGR